MAVIVRLMFLGLVLIGLAQCRDDAETFQCYSVDPLRAAFARNEIAGYVTFITIGDTIAKGDSVSLDRNGNIVSKINVSGWSKTETLYTYDSLSRLVHESYRGDIHNEICIEYDPQADAKRVVKYTYYCNVGDSSILEQETIMYDDRLEKIIQRMEISPKNDTTLVLYTYKGDAILTESSEMNGLKAFQKEYFYEDDKLIDINTNLTGLVDDDDYLSWETGLIDSTITRRERDTVVIYYKYYHKAPQAH